MMINLFMLVHVCTNSECFSIQLQTSGYVPSNMDHWGSEHPGLSLSSNMHTLLDLNHEIHWTM